MFQEISIINIIYISCSAFLVLSVLFILIYYRYTRRIIVNELKVKQMKIDYQKDLLRNEIVIAEKERESIARDLHDEVGGLLTFAKMNLSKLEACKDVEPIMEVAFSHCSESLTKALEDIRQISHDLLPPQIELFGLKSALEELISKNSSIIDIKLSNNTELNDLSKFESLQIYRIVFEFITNSIKHAKANMIQIVILNLDEELHISVKDDGKGFDIGDKSQINGLGMKNMESRMNSINALFEIKSEIGIGTEIFIKMQQHKKNGKS